MSTVKDVISLRFKSRQAEGVLLHGEGQRGDYITLELHEGKLDLHLNLGDLHTQQVLRPLFGNVFFWPAGSLKTVCVPCWGIYRIISPLNRCSVRILEFLATILQHIYLCSDK